MMERLPIEIWIRIISVTRQQDLLVLSTTCKLLGVIAQASLYRNVFLCNNSDATKTREADIFQTSVMQNPGLLGLVHKLSLNQSSPYSAPSLEHQKVNHSLLSNFPNFSNLQALDLYGLYIDADFRTTLHSLDVPYLRTISLEMCLIDNRSPGSPTGTFLESTISEVILEGSTFLGTFPPIICARLRHLTICAHLEELDQTDKILTSYMLPSVVHTLTTLKIHAVSETLFYFLESSPQIRRLELSRFLKFSPLSELSGTAIPLLEAFSGPAEYSGIFVNGRPVHTAELTLGYTAPPDILLPLRNSTVGITKITFFFLIEPLHMKSILQQIPPTLRQLAWETGARLSESEVTSWMPTLQHLPNLNVLEIRTPRSWGDHATLVNISSKVIPPLQEFTFWDFGGSYDRWLRRKDATWERYVTQVE